MNTLQNKINNLPEKSFQVLAAAIKVISYNESDCEFEDIKVQGLNDHAIAGCLSHLTDFLDSEDLEDTGSGQGHLITLNWDYNVYQIQDAINARLTETAETAETTNKPNGDEMNSNKPKAKRLKETTIAKYSNKQLINHLDRLQDKLTEPLYRVTACNTIFAYDRLDRIYFFECSNTNREAIIECIRKTWNALSI